MFTFGGKNYKYQTFFEAFAKSVPPVNKEVKSQLAIASLESLTGIFDQEVLQKIAQNPDILYIVSNLILADYANLNDDCVRLEDLYKVAPLFKSKFLDLEHNRSEVKGFIDEIGWSAYPNNELINEEDVLKYETPVQLVIGGVIWRVVDPELANLIEEASNENSESYQKLSESFELLFDSYTIAVGPDRYVKNARIIDRDSSEWERFDKILRKNGGTGKDGANLVYRVLGGDLLPVGAGIVKNPASGIRGIAVVTQDSQLEVEEPIDNDDGLAKANEIIIKNPEICVTKNKSIIMLTKLDDIKDPVKWDTLNKLEAVAAFESIQKTFEVALLEKSTEWANQLAEKDALAKAATEKQTETAARAEALSLAVAELTKKLEGIEAAEKAKLAEANFNSRMGALDEAFDLEDEDRALLVEEVREVATQEAFAAWFDKKKKLMKEKTKAYKKAQADKMTAECAKAGVTLVINEKTLDVSEVLASVIQKTQELPPISTEPSRDIKTAMHKAFSEGITVGTV